MATLVLSLKYSMVKPTLDEAPGEKSGSEYDLIGIELNTNV